MCLCIKAHKNIHVYPIQIIKIYNLGGGRNNSLSILEAFYLIEDISGKKMKYQYQDDNRIGDHICYISDLSKMKLHYKKWDITKSLSDIFQEIYYDWDIRLNMNQ